MSDSFGRESHSFVAQFDRLRLQDLTSVNDLPPEKSLVRPLLAQAEALSIQRSNPFRDASIRDLLAIDLADALTSSTGPSPNT